MLMLGLHWAEFVVEFIIKTDAHDCCPSLRQKVFFLLESVRAEGRDWCYKHIKITS